jgi:hypothetical protein
MLDRWRLGRRVGGGGIPHLRVWLKEEFVAPMEWGFVARAGQMRNSIFSGISGVGMI